MRKRKETLHDKKFSGYTTCMKIDRPACKYKCLWSTFENFS